MKSFLCLPFVILSLSLFAVEVKPVLHALLIGDTTVPDIGVASTADLAHMEASLSAIAHHTGVRLRIKKLQGRECSIDSVQKALLSLQATSHDIVLFYYTGHGSMDPCGSRWPVMTPSSDKGVGLLGSVVVDFFRHHRHQLNIVLFDCCNFAVSRYPSSL